MKAAIIGASSESLHTIEKAKSHDLYVIAFDGNPNAEGLKYADKSVVVDISNEKETIEAVKKEQVDFILTVPIGRYLTTIGAINDALSLPGITKEMATYCTDKYLFHKTLNDAGLRNCKCTLYNSGCTMDKNFSFPIIAKPRYGSGSRAVYFISDEAELDNIIDNELSAVNEDYVIEECIEGTEYGIDAAVIDNTLQLILVRRKENTPLPARQAVSYTSDWDNNDIFYDYLGKIIKTLGLNECLMHADLILSADGPFVIELSARPSGHYLHNLFTPLCTGVDMAESYILHRLGEKDTFKNINNRNLMIHFFDYEGEVIKIPSNNELKELPLIQYICNIKVGDVLQPVTNGHSLMGRGYYILEVNENYKTYISTIKSLFQFK